MSEPALVTRSAAGAPAPHCNDGHGGGGGDGGGGGGGGCDAAGGKGGDSGSGGGSCEGSGDGGGSNGGGSEGGGIEGGGMLDAAAPLKWRSWVRLRGIQQEAAKQMYVQLVQAAVRGDDVSTAGADVDASPEDDGATADQLLLRD